MIPRNPFFIGNTEKIDTDSLFLSLFNAKAIEYIKSDYIYKIVFFRSTPGAGKSSVFRLFSPNVLRELVGNNNPNYKETKTFLEDLEVITSESINVLGVELSCAGNYSIIDDLYSNGKRTQLFFALLNLRITRTALKNLLLLNKLALNDLNRITFADISPDIASSIKSEWTGEEVYNWAIDEENRICKAFDDIDAPESIPFTLNSLSFLSLINANNLLLDNKKIVQHTLLMIDDLHLLTKRQKDELREEIFKQKHTFGIWIAERISSLKYDEILGTTGDKPRDYIEIFLEQEIANTTKDKQNFLGDIADRRVKITYSDTIGDFRSCLEESVSEHNKIKKAIENLKSYIFEDSLNQEIFDYFLENYRNDYNGAVFLRALKILIDRKLADDQLSFISKKQIKINDVINENKKAKLYDPSILSSAELYLCIENKIPYYFGSKRLFNLSTNNIEQFLEFSGAIFERKIAEHFISSKKRKDKVSAVEQEEIIKKVAQAKWKSINRQYTNYINILSLLENICLICVENRKKALASYNGGSYTGIGIKEAQLDEILSNTNDLDVTKALANAVASNYITIKDVAQGKTNEKWKVFYLNRWICVLNDLPLSYGGWKPISKNKYKNLIKKRSDFDNPTLEDFSNE